MLGGVWHTRSVIYKCRVAADQTPPFGGVALLPNFLYVSAFMNIVNIVNICTLWLLSQRDRFLALGDAVRRKSGAVLVVLLRADSSQAQTLQTANLTVDNGSAATRTYSAAANSALTARAHTNHTMPAGLSGGGSGSETIFAASVNTSAGVDGRSMPCR